MLKRRFHGVHLILTALGGAALACLILGLLVGPQALTVLEGLGAVRTAFVGDYDPDAALDTAMEGLVYGLGDRWSYYLTAEGYEAQKQSAPAVPPRRRGWSRGRSSPPWTGPPWPETPAMTPPGSSRGRRAPTWSSPFSPPTGASGRSPSPGRPSRPSR